MPTPSPGFRAIQVAVREHVHADLRREAFDKNTSISEILRGLLTEHLAGRTGDEDLRRAFEAGRRAERERIIAAVQRQAPVVGLPTQPPGQR